MTIGVIVVSFHLSTFVIAAGIAGPFSLWSANVIYGGTYGKRLADNGPVTGRLPITLSVSKLASDNFLFIFGGSVAVTVAL